jgi:hypothetical protein
MSRNIDVMSFAVVENGEINREKTLDLVEAALDAEIEIRSKDQEVLSGALQAFWAENPGLSANTPAVITTVLSRPEVGFTAKTYDRLRERLAAIIHSDDRHYTVKGAGNNSGLNYMSDEEYAAFRADGLNPAKRAMEAKKAKKSSK